MNVPGFSRTARTMCGRAGARPLPADEQELIPTDLTDLTDLIDPIDGRRRESRRHGIRRRENDENQSCGRRNGGIRSRGSNDFRRR
jgi:hypothetical protein